MNDNTNAEVTPQNEVTPQPAALSDEDRQRIVNEFLAGADHDTLAALSPAYNRKVKQAIDKGLAKVRVDTQQELSERQRQEQYYSQAEGYYDGLDSATFKGLMQDPQHRRAYDEIKARRSGTPDLNEVRLAWAEELVSNLRKRIEEDEDYSGLDFEELLQESDVSNVLGRVADFKAGRKIEVAQKEITSTIRKEVEATVTDIFAKLNIAIPQPSQPEGQNMGGDTDSEWKEFQTAYNRGERNSTADHKRMKDYLNNL